MNGKGTTSVHVRVCGEVGKVLIEYVGSELIKALLTDEGDQDPRDGAQGDEQPDREIDLVIDSG